jgi:PHD/YefM family antitoxin component YafN of YafNO toxin-antitoxin module
MQQETEQITVGDLSKVPLDGLDDKVLIVTDKGKPLAVLMDYQRYRGMREHLRSATNALELLFNMK